MALTFYHVRWCPECAVVRERLDALHVPYEDVIVPDARAQRKQVFDVSGQYYVPVITDGDAVLTETWDILEYLEQQYGSERDRAPEDNQPPQKQKTGAAAELSDDDQFPSCQR